MATTPQQSTVMPDDFRESRMSVFEAILARRSVRSYAAHDLHRSTIKTLLEAAVRAPTAVHEEPGTFVVIQDKAALKRLSDHAKPLFVGRPGAPISIVRATHLRSTPRRISICSMTPAR